MKRRALNSRERILEAAAQVFGQRGYKAATIREICRAAGVGVASVNYYFRNKESLYLAILEDLIRDGFEKYPMDHGIDAMAPLAVQLRVFIRSFLLRMAGDRSLPGGAERSLLLAREIAEPSPAMNALVERYLKTQKKYLITIVKKLLGPRAPIERVHLCALSIVGQCLQYVYAWRMIERMGVSPGWDEAAMERVARHIAQFSMGGIARVKNEK
ncbi:MAG: CerR family C-terminal domain-containing protein [Candidatus Sumerlaeota bacterium]|nr:CerR family C-terminal domain-containing protein [Candidatus Sumerlaeota bacterium]